MRFIIFLAVFLSIYSSFHLYAFLKLRRALSLHLGTGAIIAVIVFSISVVTYPMLYDRDVDFVTAMSTSVRLVLANPVSMLTWCAIIAVLTGLSLLVVFAGLFVTLPVLGHASWHLYRKAVNPPAKTA